MPLRICGRVGVNAAIATRLACNSKFHTIAENHFSHIFTCILYVQDNLSCKFRSIVIILSRVAEAILASGSVVFSPRSLRVFGMSGSLAEEPD